MATWSSAGSRPVVRWDVSHPLGAGWARRLPAVSPNVSHSSLPQDRWVRFHSLPGGLRYPRRWLLGRRDWRELLTRHTTVIEELCALTPAGYLSRPEWPDDDTASAANVRWQSTGLSWQAWAAVVAGDAPPLTFLAAAVTWPSPWGEWWLRATAEDEVRGALIARDLSWVAAPYDGGIDVMLPTTEHRNAMRERHAAWLPTHGNLEDAAWCWTSSRSSTAPRSLGADSRGSCARRRCAASAVHPDR